MTQLIYTSAIQVTESDTTPVPGGTARAFMNDSLLVEGIRVTTINGEVVSFDNLQPGQIIELAITHVHATFTSADKVMIFS